VSRARWRITCRGAVQGVGFRPTVHRLASELGLTGSVRNDPAGATTEVEGDRSAVQAFLDRLPLELPPLARLDGLSVDELGLQHSESFEVITSELGARAGALVPPDASLCHDCRAEMESATDRRFRYPFTTCTNCGPRFSLVCALPYDRQRTTMACFPLCARCEQEYTNPSNRRFHAEPVCCPECGPSLWLANADGHEVARGAHALEGAQVALLGDSIVAIKGLGGFQLACRADSATAVRTLRARKARPSKPLAVMVRDLDEARRIAFLSPEDEALMASPRSPIVLARRRPGADIVEEVAPGIADLGILLPTTPLHVELLRRPNLPPLVMTSGNLSEEPICKSNREALRILPAIADLFLLHDRDIARRVDDSVVRSSDNGPVILRRARGWVPEPLPLPVAAPQTITAVGGHLQVTGCVAVGDRAFPSQHVGDLDGEPARLFLREVILGLEEFLETRPQLIVSDSHPDYPSRWLAEELVHDRGGRRARRARMLPGAWLCGPRGDPRRYRVGPRWHCVGWRVAPYRRLAAVAKPRPP
jgi:hydrogenase maturation protein HypF